MVIFISVKSPPSLANNRFAAGSQTFADVCRSLRDDGGRDAGRTVRVLQRYETINSDVLSEPSSASMDGVPLSPRKPLDVRCVQS